MHRSFPFPFFFLVIRGMRLADLNSCSGGMINGGSGGRESCKNATLRGETKQAGKVAEKMRYYSIIFCLCKRIKLLSGHNLIFLNCFYFKKKTVYGIFSMFFYLASKCIGLFLGPTSQQGVAADGRGKKPSCSADRVSMHGDRWEEINELNGEEEEEKLPSSEFFRCIPLWSPSHSKLFHFDEQGTPGAFFFAMHKNFSSVGGEKTTALF